MDRQLQDIRRDDRAVIERDDLMIARVCACQMAQRIVKSLHVVVEQDSTVHAPRTTLHAEDVGRGDDAPAPRA